MNYSEIIEKLKDSDISVNNFAYEDYNVEELGLGEIKEVEQYGGEGQGDTWYSVKYFVDHDVYIRVEGWYSSYEGSNFDGWSSCKEVKPVKKTITVYNDI